MQQLNQASPTQATEGLLCRVTGAVWGNATQARDKAPEREGDKGSDNTSMSVNCTGFRAHPDLWNRRPEKAKHVCIKDLPIIRAEALSWRGENRIEGENFPWWHYQG